MRILACLLATVLALVPAVPGTRAQSQSLPDLGGAGDVALPPALERRIGEHLVREIRFRDPTYLDDAQIVDYLDSLGARLGQAAGARQQFEFFALRDHTVNAFALPGGFVGVHTGLLTTAETESELASVVAHELAHVTQRHIARMLVQQQQLQLPVMMAIAAAILLGRSRPDLALGAAAGAQAGAIQAALGYSRDFEREADRVGLQTLQGAGFDIAAMATMFDRMQRSTRIADDGTLPGYLRTHPITTERIADVQNKAASMPYRQHPDSLEFHLVRAKLRADAGEPRETLASLSAALRERRYVSEAAARYGLAVALLRARRVAEAQAEIDRLRALGAVSPMIDLLAARVHQARHDTDGALALLAEARVRHPYWRSVAYTRIDLLHDAGRHEQALSAAAEALRQYSRDPRLYAAQAKNYAALGKRLLQHQAQGEAYALQGSLPAAIEQLQLARAAGDGDFYQLSVVEARLKELRAQYAAELKEAKR